MSSPATSDAVLDEYERVAAAYRAELEKRATHFDVIAFGIFHAGYGPNNYAPFEAAFEALLVEDAARNTQEAYARRMARTARTARTARRGTRRAAAGAAAASAALLAPAVPALVGEAHATLS